MSASPTVAERGSLRSQTHELALGYQVINNRDLAWVVSITGDRTRQVITEYPLPERLNLFGQQPATFFLAEGAKLGVMYGNKAVRNINELYDDPAKKALSGPGQTWDPEKFIVNEEGFVVAKATHRCGVDLKVLGTKNPDGTGGPHGRRAPINYVPARLCEDGSAAPPPTSWRSRRHPDFNAT